MFSIILFPRLSYIRWSMSVFHICNNLPWAGVGVFTHVITLRPSQHGRHFQDDILKRIFLIENGWISHNISLIFVPEGQIDNILSFVQIMAGRRSGDKQLSESITLTLPTHICVTRPQWVIRVQITSHRLLVMFCKCKQTLELLDEAYIYIYIIYQSRSLLPRYIHGCVYMALIC